ncbi:MAG: hypothetical protein AAF654_05825 [Myxococcota bacterium]
MRFAVFILLTALPLPGLAAKLPPDVVNTIAKTAAEALAADCLANGWANDEVILKLGKFNATAGWKRTANKVRAGLGKVLKESIVIRRSKATHTVTGELTVTQEAVSGGEVWTFSFAAEVVSVEDEGKVWIGEHVERVQIQQ